MLPNFLLPESVARASGSGAELELDELRGKLLVLTLGITQIIEQESLEISIWGSSDGEDWGLRPLARFPPKFYCGIYSILLNLASRPDIQYLRAEWKMGRWGKTADSPMFGFYLYAEESGTRVSVAAAVA